MGKHKDYKLDNVITGEEYLFGSNTPASRQPSANYQLNKILAWLLTKIAGVDLHYEHVQDTASAVWNIPHNLNKKPAYQVFASDGERILKTMEHVDLDNGRIVWDSPMTGSVTLN